MVQKVAIYPGTFDPVTHGHMDIIKRAANFMDHLIVAIAVETSKSPVFSPEKRLEMIERELEKHAEFKGRVSAKIFKGLLVNFAEENSCSIIIRGLRAVSDFEYEFQMSCMNSKLNSKIETLFLPASEKTHFVSSTLVRQVARLGGDVSEFVSNDVNEELTKHFNGN